MLGKQHPQSNPPSKLTRRESQVIQILASRGTGATANEIQSSMAFPPSYSAVRALLKVMEDKGLLSHRQDGPRYIYEATVPQKKIKKSALREVLTGFFDGSRTALIEALFDPADGKISEKEIERLSHLIAQAKEQGK